MKRYHRLLAVMICLTLMLTACSSAAPSDSSTPVEEVTPAASAPVPEPEASEPSPVLEEVAVPTEEPAPDPTSEPAAETAATAEGDISVNETTETPAVIPGEEDYEAWYADMVEASIVSTGNNARLKKVLEKARSGGEVRVAAIGGSVTEGAGASTNTEGYAYKFAEAFKRDYCPEGADNMKFVNAGLSGTPSSLGIMRYDRDIVGLLGGAPDLLVIEFAVNDSGEATHGQAYSSMIHRALTDNPDCAVILLFAVFKSKWNMQTNYIPEGEIYGLPMVSIKDAVAGPYASGELNDVLFFSDEYHPKTYGHQIMSDCLMHLIGLIDREDPDPESEVPEKGIKQVSYEHTTLITSDLSTLEEGVSVDPGSFTLTDKALQSMFFTKKSAFGENFMHDKDGGNAPFTLKLTCSKLLLNFKTSKTKTFGLAEVLVDGTPVEACNGWASGGWNNCNVVSVIDAEESAEHTVEIRMAEGFEDTSFTILSLGYVK